MMGFKPVAQAQKADRCRSAAQQGEDKMSGITRLGFLKGSTAAAATLALGTGAQAADKLKVGFVYVGPVGDFGYSYQHDQGRIFMSKALGDRV